MKPKKGVIPKGLKAYMAKKKKIGKKKKMKKNKKKTKK